ncbi:alanine dehydrogenase/PNT, C-terminal domain protein [Lyngbya aestuarii BL J]|uniref:Alanine dehydrogenase/PNT, C-terminal domain protein n=1 Tax=Lyngbya aestuarii BL J TaxID=1348334 RepID=U7QK49_9CYAN|nr:NAD(P)-dependent oxidoreductase [Lyngbya aestuarii]ERT08268.1 alanine dehydrogenase/PNT, C-terminal domain protein [Lyngbya aestuarii BL J]
MKIGIIREGKVPIDRRVALSPQQCQAVKEKFPTVELIVQTSPIRCFTDTEYLQQGLEVRENVSDCDILLGVKEVPISDLIPNKTYLFFSHTIKKQPYNRQLLQAILDQNICLIDYECLTNERGSRVIGFGRYAGIIGAYHGLDAYGKRNHLYQLKPILDCVDINEMKAELAKVKLPAIKIAITGGGRVATGVMEILNLIGTSSVSPADFLTKSYPETVYTQLNSIDYNKTPDGSPFIEADFFQYPEQFEGDFYKYTQVTDLLIAAAYWHPDSPVLLTPEDIQTSGFKIQVIADITCDIEGSIPCTKRTSTLTEPYFDYNPHTQQLEPAFSQDKNLTIMAVDNLPSGLPRDASEDFGNQLIENIFPFLLEEDSIQMIARATIAKNGTLTPPFQYLQDYTEGKE